ncbi:MAG: nucleotide sugar dehydrogenase [Dehalococcoidia bacterium]
MASPTTITVVALGKIGLPVAALYASRGHSVVGCDINPAVVEMVNRGESPIQHEPGLAEWLRESVAAGRFRATTDTTAGVADADVVIVLVPLDVDAAKQPDFRAMDAAFDAIARGLRPGALVLVETTVPVGATRQRFLPILESESRRCGRDFFLAFSPERLQSGRIARDLAAYPRVVGGIDPASAERAAAFYRAAHDVDVIALSSAEAAEFCKLAESIERDVNIALANELALYAAAHGVDFFEVLPAANSQPQSHLLRPGLGVGGHCMPVYPYLLTGDAERAELTLAGRSINDGMPRHAAGLLDDALGGLRDRRVLVLGLTYRPGVKEAAYSPALTLIRELERRGADCRGHDPLLTPEEIARLGVAPATPDGGEPFDLVVIHTADSAYAGLDVREIPGLQAVLDCAGALDPARVAQAGAQYLAIGRPSIPAETGDWGYRGRSPRPEGVGEPHGWRESRGPGAEPRSEGVGEPYGFPNSERAIP